MNSLSIKQKLFGLGGVVIVAFLIFGGVYLYSAGIRADAAAEAARIYRIDHEEAAIKSGILQARRDEKDFLLRMDTKYLDKHRATMANVYESLGELDKNIQSGSGKQTVEELTSLVKAYDQEFQAMSEMQIKVGLNEKVGLLGALRTSVHNVEGYLEKLGKRNLGGRSQSAFDKMMIKMLMMRRHEKDFLARKKDKYIDKQAKRKSEFYSILYSSGLGAHDVEAIRTNMEAYHRDFNALAKGMKEVEVAIASFREKIHATDPALEKVEALVKHLENENQSYQATANTRVATLLVATMIIGGAVILGFIFLLAVAISRGLDGAVKICRDVADGKLGLDIKPTSNDEIGQLLSSLKFMDENLTRVVTEVQDAVGSIGNASQQISEGNTSLSQRTEEQASSLEETASSMEEMTGTVKQNADSAAEAKQLADANRQRAATGAEVVTQTVNAMSEINESSSKIADIIGTIDGIAFQTNLLALNAAVEAARAGEQGRGFAVVASEVRTLAQRSAEAAKEIKALIEDSVGKVKVGTDLVDKSGKTLEEIIGGTQKVADIIAEIAAASQEQASGIDQVNNAITQMDNMTQENAALVEESAAASRSMEEQALTLDQLISFFRVDGQTRLDSAATTVKLGNGSGKGNGHAKPGQNTGGDRTHLEHLKQAKTKPSKDDTSEWEQF